MPIMVLLPPGTTQTVPAVEQLRRLTLETKKTDGVLSMPYASGISQIPLVGCGDSPRRVIKSKLASMLFLLAQLCRLGTYISSMLVEAPGFIEGLW
jgi:hypothetical protein